MQVEFTPQPEALLLLLMAGDAMALQEAGLTVAEAQAINRSEVQ